MRTGGGPHPIIFWQKAIDEVRAEKDRNIEIINDKSRSVQDEFQKLTNTTKDKISSITKEATHIPWTSQQKQYSTSQIKQSNQ
jgi:hypothetical protein